MLDRVSEYKIQDKLLKIFLGGGQRIVKRDTETAGMRIRAQSCGSPCLLHRDFKCKAFSEDHSPLMPVVLFFLKKNLMSFI